MAFKANNNNRAQRYKQENIVNFNTNIISGTLVKGNQVHLLKSSP